MSPRIFLTLYILTTPSIGVAEPCLDLIPEQVSRVEVTLRYGFSEECDVRDVEVISSDPPGYGYWAKCQIHEEANGVPVGDWERAPGRPEIAESFGSWLVNFRAQHPDRFYARRFHVIQNEAETMELNCYFTEDWKYTGAEICETCDENDLPQPFDNFSALAIQERKFGFHRY